MRSGTGHPLKRERKVTLIILLFACGANPNSSDTFDTAIDEFVCIDGRGYRHEPGAFWQCDGLCLTCTCTDGGETILAPDGPKIVTKDCEEEEKPMGPQLPPSPK